MLRRQHLSGCEECAQLCADCSPHNGENCHPSGHIAGVYPTPAPGLIFLPMCDIPEKHLLFPDQEKEAFPLVLSHFPFKLSRK